MNDYQPFSDIRIRDIGNDLAAVESPFVFFYMGRFWVVYIGFVFDGASIPKPFRFIATPFTSWLVKAAAGHDLLARYFSMPEYWVEVDGHKRPMRRREMDRMFLYAMRHDILEAGGFRWLIATRLKRAHTLYLGLRAGGWAFMRDGDGTPPRKVRRYTKQKGARWVG